MDSNEIDLLEQLLTKGFDSNYRFDITKLIKHFSEKMMIINRILSSLPTRITKALNFPLTDFLLR